MSRVLVDTSALLALLVPSDVAHEKAKAAFDRLKTGQDLLVITSYVLVETYALIGHRFGLDAVRRFRDNFAPLFEEFWVDKALHERGLDLLLEEGQAPDFSLVDAVSFLVFREQNLAQVFAYDRHFTEEGFSLL